jgi:hypothetical protein
MAALREPMTASGTMSLRYVIATPVLNVFAGQELGAALVRWNPCEFFLSEHGTILQRAGIPEGRGSTCQRSRTFALHAAHQNVTICDAAAAPRA